MFDLAQAIATKPWHTTLAIGDIVLFRFPTGLRDAETGLPAMRPCLVLEVERSGAGTRMILAPGTSRVTRARSGYDIPVQEADEIAKAGLERRMRFQAQFPLSVSVANPHLRVGSGQESPVIGRLTDLSRERMQWVRARLHAEHDIAAEERRLEREAREVTVATQAPRRNNHTLSLPR